MLMVPKIRSFDCFYKKSVTVVDVSNMETVRGIFNGK